MPSDSLIAGNAFSSIVIDGLVKKAGQNVNLSCIRGNSIPTDVINMSYGATGKKYRVRPPSKLPPPGDITLHVSLKEELGSGRIGTVYAVNPTSSEDSIQIPPLVIKVSDRYRSRQMAREAWFYEELEHLQGVSIPRCYGFFQIDLTEDHGVLNWRETSEESAEEADEEERNYLRRSVASHQADAFFKAKIKQNPTSNYEMWGGRWGAEDIEPVIPPDPAAGLSFVRQHHLISVLVLERLGGHLPVGVPIDEATERDIYEIYGDLGRLGIETIDVHWRNILEASDTSERKVCPYHGHVHAWRLIDFDLARKSNETMEAIDSAVRSYMEPILQYLVQGSVIGFD